MNKVIEWIKGHLTVVVCGSVALLSLATLAWGVFDTSAADIMQQDARLYSNLTNLKPVNQSVIEAAKKTYEDNHRQLMKAVEEFEKMSPHKPISDRVFPKPADQAAPYEFRNRFVVAQLALLTILNAKDKPTPQEIEYEQHKIDSVMQKEALEQQMGAGGGTGGTPGGPPLAGGGFGGGPTNPAFGGARRASSEMTLEQRLVQDAALRLSILRAREIHCYASLASLDQRANPVLPDGSPPSLDLMWYSQMALWLQEDVVKALAGLNQTVADALKARQEHAWVGNLPVKHLVQITVGDYLPQSSGGAGTAGSGFGMGGSSSDAGPSNDPSRVFTNRGATDEVDVIHFTMELVIEAAMLPAVIDSISGAGIYTALQVFYEAVPPNLEYVDYIYGSAPIIRVRLLFEGCFLRSKYDAWMPEEVKNAIKEGTAGVKSTAGGGMGGSPGGGFFSAPRPGGGGGPAPRPGRGRSTGS